MDEFSIPAGFPMQVTRQDWRPMERHPRPLRRRNPEEMGLSIQSSALRFNA